MVFPFHRTAYTALLTLVCLACLAGPAHAQDTRNIASPARHDYANPAKGRAGHDYTDAEVNSLRIYDFYSRQADYYMAMSPSQWPKHFPAFPGLDGGTHGHWGKYNQNSHQDGRWNDMETGSAVEGIYHHEKTTVVKGVNLRLGDKGQLSTVFDPLNMGYRNTWHNGFVEIDPQRWGVVRGSMQVGDSLFEGSKYMSIGQDKWITETNSPEARYHGFYRHGKKVILSYTLGDTPILDHPWALSDSKVMTRTIQAGKTLKPFQLRLIKLDATAKEQGPLQITQWAGPQINRDRLVLGQLLEANR
jgi:hypothetical protein